MRYRTVLVATICLMGVRIGAQTTQGVILGRLSDSVTGRPVESASIACTNEATTASYFANVDSNGAYSIGSLSPGRYRLTVEASRYQTQQARALELPVAGREELNFRLRPLSDIWEAGQYKTWRVPESQQVLGYYGPDVDTSRVAILNANRGLISPLEVSLSDVVSSTFIENLPLVGRDVYTMLLLLPGVTSDTATARGLGFSVNGQKPSSSNYLLDGVENNNLLVTGPSSAATPEFVSEYRVSTANYSAEYGRTTGFVANAVTHSGTNQWHGRVLTYGETQYLNANGFQENAQGFARPTFTQLQPGFTASGPILKDRLFVFAGFEAFLSHGRDDPQQFALPTQSFIDSTSASSYAGQLLRRYRPETTPPGEGDVGFAFIAPATSLDRIDGIVRLDYQASAREQVFLRAALDNLAQHNLLGSPYPDFALRFRQNSASVAAGLLSRIGSSSQNEFRVNGSGNSIRADTPHAEVPNLAIDQLRINGVYYNIAMPGRTNAFDYRNASRNWELLDNWSWTAGRQVFKAGGGFFQRNIDLAVSVYPQGYFDFASLKDFAQNQLEVLQIQYDRTSTDFAPVSPARKYRYRQFYGFAQDSAHVTDRLTLDFGLRYEFFGSPVNIGSQKDLPIKLGNGPDVVGSITNAAFVLPGAGDQAIYSSSAGHWAVRTGVAWDPIGSGRTVIRASYGTFYDRPFDNLWANIIQNRYVTGTWAYTQPVPLGAPLREIEAAGQFQSFTAVIYPLVFQPKLRAPWVQSAFVGVQQSLKPGISLEVHALASRGRQLITTDVVNRPGSLPSTLTNLFGYLNPTIGSDLDYRANQGGSNYAGLVTALRFHKRRLDGQVAYTWSHSLDNQSEPLAGTFFSFNTFNAPQLPYISSFTRQFASSLDWGNSDFDQRQNLVFFFTYQLGSRSGHSTFHGLLRNWTVAGLGAVRSGLPYTVYAASNGSEFLMNDRANLIAPANVYISQPVPGGRRLLNAAAFAPPGPNMIGSAGRNAFYGPGLFNTDASVARTFAIPGPLESLRFTVRADFYNLFNHANLNNPDSGFGQADFGIALFGRREINSGFPLLAPLAETARQTQIMLRIDF